MATTLWCHLVSFVMYISGAKFEEHCFNISRDICYSVFYYFSCKPHDVNLSITKKDFPKRKTPFYFEKPLCKQ